MELGAIARGKIRSHSRDIHWAKHRLCPRNSSASIEESSSRGSAVAAVSKGISHSIAAEARKSATLREASEVKVHRCITEWNMQSRAHAAHPGVPLWLTKCSDVSLPPVFRMPIRAPDWSLAWIFAVTLISVPHDAL